MSNENGDSVELSSRWIWLLKIHLGIMSAMMPFFVIWASWLTNETIKTIYWRDSGNVVIQADVLRAEARQSELRAALMEAMKLKLASIETDTALIKSSVARIEKEIARDP